MAARQFAPIFLCVILGWRAAAQDTETTGFPGRIHSADKTLASFDPGKPPTFVAPPPVGSNGLSTNDCAARASQVENYSAFANSKILWNMRKVTSLVSPYKIPVCSEAERAFDQAAELSNGTENAAFVAASSEASTKTTVGKLLTLYMKTNARILKVIQNAKLPTQTKAK